MSVKFEYKPIKEPADMSWNKAIQKTYVPKPDALNNNNGETGAWSQLRNYPGRIAGMFAGVLDKSQNFGFGLPLPKELATNITSFFGVERDYINTQGEKKHDIHKGIDIGAEEGTPIIAPADGKVKLVEDYGKKFYGKLTVIEHDNGIETYYGHQSEILVKQGQWIQKGYRIGSTGNTGNTTGPHLHYEIRKNGKPVNPLNFGW